MKTFISAIIHIIVWSGVLLVFLKLIAICANTCDEIVTKLSRGKE